MPGSFFLTLDAILFIHQQEIQVSGGDPNIRDLEGIKACVDAPKASYGGDISKIYAFFKEEESKLGSKVRKIKPRMKRSNSAK